MRTLTASVITATLVVTAIAALAQEPGGKPLFVFGVVADCQYADVEGTKRRYRLSPRKLAASVEHFNRLDLSFAIHLGDFIDRDYQSFTVVVPIFERLRARCYHVLGNHDFSVADHHKATVPKVLGMEARYYDFVVSGWRFVVLDGSDVSLFAHSADSPKQRAAQAYYRQLNVPPPKWNGAVGAAQLRWVRRSLDKAAREKQRVIVFCHFPVNSDDVHDLWNAEEVRKVIESSSAVAAFISGHKHAGDYRKSHGIHYLTLKAMVDTEESAYAVVSVYPDRLEVRGYGREPDRTLKLAGP